MCSNCKIFKFIGKNLHQLNSGVKASVPEKGKWHFICSKQLFLSTLESGDANKLQYNGSLLVKVIAWCLFGASPLPKPMLTYWRLDPRNHRHWNSKENKHFFQRPAIISTRVNILLQFWNRSEPYFSLASMCQWHQFWQVWIKFEIGFISN